MDSLRYTFIHKDFSQENRKALIIFTFIFYIFTDTHSEKHHPPLLNYFFTTSQSSDPIQYVQSVTV